MKICHVILHAAGNGSFNGKPQATVFSVLPERVGSKRSRLRLAVKRKTRMVNPHLSQA